MVVEPGHVVARLVAVCVLADQPGDVGLVAAGRIRRGLEDRVEPFHETLLPAHRLDQAVDVVRHEEAVLPGVGLGEVVVDAVGIEGREPALVSARAHETALGVEQVAPALAAVPVLGRDLRLVHPLRHLRDTPVVVGVLERLRDRFALVVDADEALPLVGLEPEVIARGAVDHRLECELPHRSRGIP